MHSLTQPLERQIDRPRPAQSKYRDDIDGLRAVAVIFVMIYHLNKSWLPSGFVGVDIFFVISGYVVATAAASRADLPPLRQLKVFWMKRIARIYPAMLFMIAVTLLPTLMFSPAFPRELILSYVRTGFAAMLGLGNVYLHRIGSNYLLGDQADNFFLHTWSLGVEEQFYVIFALMVLGLANVVSLGVSRRALGLGLLSFLTVISAALMLLLANAYPSSAYYMIQFRFWELGIGCILALSPGLFPGGDGAGRSPAITAARAIAAALILASALWPGGVDRFPTSEIGVATLAVAFRIASGRGRVDGFTRVLSSRPLKATGLLSYSLYLWHWPVYVLLTITVGLESWPARFAALGMTALASVASYSLIEKPLRRTDEGFRRATAPFVVACAAAIVVLTGIATVNPSALYVGASRYPAAEWLPDADAAYAEDGAITKKRCDLSAGASVASDFPAECRAKVPGPNARTLFLIGDSLAFADWGMALGAAHDLNLNVVAYSHEGCDLNFDRRVYPPSCAAYWNGMPDRLRRVLKPGDVVLLATLNFLGDTVDRSFAKAEWEAIYQVAREANARLVIQAPPPQFGRDAFICTPEWFRWTYDGCTRTRADLEEARRPVTSLIDAFAKARPGVSVWDPVELLCVDRGCSQFKDGKPVFRNWDHLSYAGSKQLAPGFATFLKGLDLKPN